MVKKLEQITGVAIYLNGRVWSMSKPKRHHHIIYWLATRGFDTPVCGDQGFVTSKGRFVNRSEGARLALNTGQIDKLKWGPDLFSEDLW